MSPYEGLKCLHVSCVLLSGAGFVLRGVWRLRDDPRLHHPLARRLPHIVDSLLLASAVGMLVLIGMPPWRLDWLSAKLVALVGYIGLGALALRGRRRDLRVAALAVACVLYGWMVSVALLKQPAGILVLVSR